MVLEGTEETVESASEVELVSIRFNKATRQEIIEEFCQRHHGSWQPRLFFEEVSSNPSHPARDWFTWDLNRGWLEHNIDLARRFAYGLKVSFSIEVVSGSGRNLVVKQAPFVISPLSTRNDGGGYILMQQSELAALREEAGFTLRQWSKRYEAVLSGSEHSRIATIIRVLEAKENAA